FKLRSVDPVVARIDEEEPDFLPGLDARGEICEKVPRHALFGLRPPGPPRGAVLLDALAVRRDGGTGEITKSECGGSWHRQASVVGVLLRRFSAHIMHSGAGGASVRQVRRCRPC